jgi:prevent-host-death family protein
VILRNVSESNAELSSLLEEVLKGNEVVVAKGGHPVARLLPYERSKTPRKPGALAGRILIADDFDELPADIAEAFGANEKQS